MLRVKYREAGGGHEILPKAIKQNFAEAPNSLKLSQSLFDPIVILDNSVKRDIPKLILEIQNDRVVNSGLDEGNKTETSIIVGSCVGRPQKRKY